MDNTDTCVEGCVAAACGDGYMGPGEGCDDGNQVDDDECDNLCAPTSCGDGITQQNEECDDANMDNTDDCLDTCELAACGDGFVHVDGEDCDDGNLINNDGCNDDCAPSIGVRNIAMGRKHTCALTWAGQVKCWGEAFQGQLGYANINDIGDDELPSSVGFVDTGGLAVDIAAGAVHSCVVHDDHSVVCWGQNTAGTLGYENVFRVGDDELPADLGPVDVGADTIQISAGGATTCARTSTAKVRCWGASANGQTGYATIDPVFTPGGDVDIGADVTDLSVGLSHACVVTVNGTVRCWGGGLYGMLGYANTDDIGDDEVPADAGDVDVGDENGLVVDVDCGEHKTCVRFEDGAVKCWGLAQSGALGQPGFQDPMLGDDETPASVGAIDIGGPALEIEVSGGSTCARLAGGALRCWGPWNHLGHGLNLGIVGDDETPASIGDVPVGVGVSSIGQSPYAWHWCVATVEGEVRCWGDNISGQLGQGNVDWYGNAMGETPANYGDVSLF